MPYKWPSKIKKYGITCPFQRVLVAKYENQIDWNGDLIDTPDALDRHICERMLPKLRERIDPGSKRSNYCLTVNLAHMLANPARHIDEAREIQQREGNEAAAKFLLDHINGQKTATFESWWSYVTKENPVYKTVPAFQYLILRPVIESSGAKCTRAPVNPDASALAYLFDDIKAQKVGPCDHLLRKLCALMAFGATAEFDAKTQGLACRWVSISRHEPRAANRVAVFSQGSGWCVSSPSMAAVYLRESDFHILIADDRPVVAIRTDRNVAVEIEGRHNRDPGEWWPRILLFCNVRVLRFSHRSDAAAKAAKEIGRSVAAINDVKEMAEYLKGDPAHVQFVVNDPADDDRFRALVERAWRACIVSDPCSVRLIPDWMVSDPAIHKDIEHGWYKLVRMDPKNIVHLPQVLRTSALIAPVKRAAWVHLVKSDTMGYERCPPELRSETEILDVRHWPWLCAIKRDVSAYDSCPDDLRRHPLIIHERQLSWVNSFSCDEAARLTCPPDVIEHLGQTEDRTLCVRFVARILTLNTSGCFSDRDIPPALRARSDFPRIRERAWAEAVKHCPPYQLAVPEDLRTSTIICPAVKPEHHARLLRWVGLIRTTPWLLDEPIKISKPLKASRAILDAYVEGWQRLFRHCPWRIWHVPLADCRSYITPSTLYHPPIIDAMAEGWIACARRIQMAQEWKQMETPVLNRPPVQLAVLKALSQSQIGDKLRRKVISDVVNATKTTANSSCSRYQEIRQEIRSYLAGTHA